MTLYEIDEALSSLVDENGEIADFEAFDALAMARDEKIENVALWIKNLNAESGAIKVEEDALKARREAKENKIDSLKNYLAHALDGQKFETARVRCSWRKSSSLKIDDEGAFLTLYPTFGRQTVSVNKEAVKAGIKAGETYTGATLAESNNLSIK